MTSVFKGNAVLFFLKECNPLPPPLVFFFFTKESGLTFSNKHCLSSFFKEMILFSPKGAWPIFVKENYVLFLKGT